MPAPAQSSQPGNDGDGRHGGEKAPQKFREVVSCLASDKYAADAPRPGCTAFGDRLSALEPAIGALGAVFVPGRVVGTRDYGLVGTDTPWMANADLSFCLAAAVWGEVIDQQPSSSGILVTGRREAVAAPTHAAGSGRRSRSTCAGWHRQKYLRRATSKSPVIRFSVQTVASGVEVLAFQARTCSPSTQIWTVLTPVGPAVQHQRLNSIFCSSGCRGTCRRHSRLLAASFSRSLGNLPGRNLLYLPYFFDSPVCPRRQNALPDQTGIR